MCANEPHSFKNVRKCAATVGPCWKPKVFSHERTNQGSVPGWLTGVEKDSKMRDSELESSLP